MAVVRCLRSQKPPRVRPPLRHVTAHAPAYPSTARRASGVKPSTAGTPPSSRGRKAHNCSPSGGTGGVSPGRAEAQAEDARSALTRRSARSYLRPYIAASHRARPPFTAANPPQFRAAFRQPPRPCPPNQPASTHPHLFQETQFPSVPRARQHPAGARAPAESVACRSPPARGEQPHGELRLHGYPRTNHIRGRPATVRMCESPETGVGGEWP